MFKIVKLWLFVALWCVGTFGVVSAAERFGAYGTLQLGNASSGSWPQAYHGADLRFPTRQIALGLGYRYCFPHLNFDLSLEMRSQWLARLKYAEELLIVQKNLQFVLQPSVRWRQWDVFFELGGARRIVSATMPDKFTQIRPQLGIGLGYWFSEHWSGRVLLSLAAGASMQQLESALAQRKVPRITGLQLALNRLF